MRMTNKIMQNNSLYNINQNKVLQDKLSTQMSTQKELTRPSDDPVVAIRALRLRSSVSEITQYYKKNSPDAESWLKVTSDGLGTVTDILTDISTNANKGANKDLTADDLDIIVTNMKSLTEEFYSTGNLDYAGRYVFTGYRTDTPMQFTAQDIAEGKIPQYKITEQFKMDSIDTVAYTNIGKLDGITSSNVSDGTHSETEQNITTDTIHRLRLAYDKIEPGKTLQLESYASGTTGWSTTIADADIAAGEDPYQMIIDANESDEEKFVYIPETGEILMSNKAYDKMFAESKAAGEDKQEFRITYDKDEWKNQDLRPEHYFTCTTTTHDVPSTSTKYNKEYLDDLAVNKEKQVIAYDVGYNQTIEVNTTADEVFTHELHRDIEDLEKALEELKNISDIRLTIDNKLKALEEGSDGYKELKNAYDAADKAYTYIRQNMHDLMGDTIKKVQGYLDVTNVAVTDNGTRMSRLDLISNRLMEQQTTFRTLQSENEDVDIADVAINLSSAELTYNSSLMATSKIMQTTLMNYI